MAIATVLAGCGAGGQDYLTAGIGTELTAPNLMAAEAQQRQYFDYLCRLSADQQSTRNSACKVNDWDLIVKQGMNDIDRRCDAYLQWLDNRKRSKGPWIAQIGDTAAATSVVLGQFNAGTKAMTIVAQVFQLITESVENYHSRLLLEIESSTIHSIVLKGRYDFRTYLQEKKIKFADKPDAEHALRSYTRLCLPFAIEAKINTFSTLGANNQKPGVDNTLGDLPVVGATPKPDDPVTGGQGNGRLPPTPAPISTWFSKRNFDVAQLHAFQRATCIPTSDTVGPQTRAAIAIVEQQLAVTKDAQVDGILVD